LRADLSDIEVEVTGTTLENSTTSLKAPPRRYNELLKADIMRHINPTAQTVAPRYRLSIGYTEQDAQLFVNPDGTASRGDLIYQSQYTLMRMADRRVLATGNIRRISSYNSSPVADYASFVSIEDARSRGISELAQDYVLRLGTLLPVMNDAQAKEVAPAAPMIQEGFSPMPLRDPYETQRPRF
jgi:hypothetical protein